MSEIFTPASTITANDQPNAFGNAIPKQYLPKAKNYASDENVMRDILTEICPVIDYCRTNRQGLEDEWRQIRNMELLNHDENRKYLGRSEAYLPLYSRVLGTRASALSKALFPSDEYMDCVEYNGSTTERARNAKGYVQWELERNAKIRSIMKPFLRQLDSYGNSPLKYTYRSKKRYEGTVKSVIQGLGDRPRPQFGEVNYDGLYLSVRSIFDFYIYPLTADSIDEATLVFEDIQMPMMEIESLGRGSREDRWVNIDKALNGGPSPYYEVKQVEKSYAHGQHHTSQDVDTSVGRTRTIQEIWTYMVLPAEAYLPGEDKECPLPVVIHLTSDYWPLCVMRNPYFHQRPPYRFQRENVEPGLIYGYGTGKIIRHLQYQANDFQNQTNDCGNQLLNPIIKRNPAMMAGPMRGIRPGQVWDVTDVDAAIKFERPPFEMLQYGMQMVAQLLNAGQDFAGAPPLMSGMKGGGASTATTTSIMQRNSLNPIQDQVEDIEQETMVPLLYGTWRNGQQFREEGAMVVLAGGAFEMTPEQFAFDAVFRYLASSQAVNSQQRNQMAIQFLQGVMPLIPHLMQLGYVVDPASVIRRIYSDGLGFRGFDEFIKKAQGAPGQMQMQPGQPPPPGVQQEQGDRIRSALEQVAGAGGAEMAPGEGEDFMDVRNGADQMASDAGSSYGSY